jgi:hypothetical protein
MFSCHHINTPLEARLKLSCEHCLETPKDKTIMSDIFYSPPIGSLIMPLSIQHLIMHSL